MRRRRLWELLLLIFIGSKNLILSIEKFHFFYVPNPSFHFLAYNYFTDVYRFPSF